MNLDLFSQTEEQIYEELRQEGVTSIKDIQSELKKRNLSEEDARRLAKQYGIDYNQSIKNL